MKSYNDLRVAILDTFQVAADICESELVDVKVTVDACPYARVLVSTDLRRKNGRDLSGYTLYLRAGKDKRVDYRSTTHGTTYIKINGIHVYFGMEDRGVINLRAVQFDETNRVDDNTTGCHTDLPGSVTPQRCAEYAAQVQEFLPLY